MRGKIRQGLVHRHRQRRKFLEVLRYLKNLLISHGHPCVKAIDGRVEAVESTHFALAPTGIIGTHPIMGQLSKSAVV